MSSVGGIADASAAPVAADARMQPTLTPKVDKKNLMTLADEFNTKSELVTSFLLSLGAEADSDPDDVASIPGDMVDTAIKNLKKKNGEEEVPISPLEAGSLVKHMKKLREYLSEPVPTEKKEMVVDSPPVVPLVETGTKRKISEVLDQMDDRAFDVPDAEECRRLRMNFKKVCGGKPAEAETPTAEQLGALKAKIDKRSAPYCDFAIFCPHGRRMAKIKRFEAQVFIDNELRQKVLRGPSDFKSWSESWRVFRTAMLSLKAAAPQTLANYYRGIEQLVTLYPNCWGLVFCADELMRSEGWDKIREELEDDEEWPEELPWDLVIRQSSYGKGDAERQHWWFTHVVAPATQGGGKPMVAQLEGSTNLPSEDGLFNGSGGGKSRQRSRGSRGGNQSKKGNGQNSGKGYNNGGKGKYVEHGWDSGKAKGKGNKNKGKYGNGKFDGGKGSKGKSNEIPK